MNPQIQAIRAALLLEDTKNSFVEICLFSFLCMVESDKKPKSFQHTDNRVLENQISSLVFAILCYMACCYDRIICTFVGRNHLETVKLNRNDTRVTLLSQVPSHTERTKK